MTIGLERHGIKSTLPPHPYLYLSRLVGAPTCLWTHVRCTWLNALAHWQTQPCPTSGATHNLNPTCSLQLTLERRLITLLVRNSRTRLATESFVLLPVNLWTLPCSRLTCSSCLRLVLTKDRKNVGTKIILHSNLLTLHREERPLQNLRSVLSSLLLITLRQPTAARTRWRLQVSRTSLSDYFVPSCLPLKQRWSTRGATPTFAPPLTSPSTEHIVLMPTGPLTPLLETPINRSARRRSSPWHLVTHRPKKLKALPSTPVSWHLVPPVSVLPLPLLWKHIWTTRPRQLTLPSQLTFKTLLTWQFALVRSSTRS